MLLSYQSYDGEDELRGQTKRPEGQTTPMYFRRPSCGYLRRVDDFSRLVTRRRNLRQTWAQVIPPSVFASKNGRFILPHQPRRLSLRLLTPISTILVGLTVLILSLSDAPKAKDREASVRCSQM